MIFNQNQIPYLYLFNFQQLSVTTLNLFLHLFHTIIYFLLMINTKLLKVETANTMTTDNLSHNFNLEQDSIVQYISNISINLIIKI